MRRYKLCSMFIGALFILGAESTTYANTISKSLYNRFFSEIAVGKTWSRHATFRDGSDKGSPYLPLYGLPHYSTGDFGHSPNFSIGVGYRFYPLLIPSISLNYIPSVKFTGNANYHNAGASQPVSSTGHSISLMLNNKIDLFDFIKQMTRSTKTYPVHPVIGGGIGISNNYSSSQVQYFPTLGSNAYTSLPSANTLSFAYNVFAGLAFQLATSTVIEVDYQYMHLGKMKTGTGSMLVYNHGCGAGGATCARAIDDTQANYNTQGVILKLTYYFG